MTLDVLEEKRFRASAKTGGFGGSTWTLRAPAGGLYTRPTTEWARAGRELLSGVWSCDDGGKYAIRQVGTEVWWYGQSSDGGRSWANVFYGRFDGRRLTGTWADLPLGGASSSGVMGLDNPEGNTLRAFSKTGGFGGSLWRR